MGRDSSIKIDGLHCRAICDEIGARLRVMLDGEASALPPRLQVLMLRLAAQDLAGSPPLAPSIGDIAPNKAAETMAGSIQAA